LVGIVTQPPPQGISSLLRFLKGREVGGLVEIYKDIHRYSSSIDIL